MSEFLASSYHYKSIFYICVNIKFFPGIYTVLIKNIYNCNNNYAVKFACSFVNSLWNKKLNKDVNKSLI